MSSASTASANRPPAAATTTTTTPTTADSVTSTPSASAQHNLSIDDTQYFGATGFIPSATLTMTEVASLPPASLEEEILTLTLTARPSVRW